MRSAKKIISTLILVALISAFCLFAFQNADHVRVRFLDYHSPELPLFAIILGFLVLGIFVTGMFTITEVIRLSRKLSKKDKQINELSKQLTLMKQKPLMEDFSENSAADTTDAEPTQEASG